MIKRERLNPAFERSLDPSHSPEGFTPIRPPPPPPQPPPPPAAHADGAMAGAGLPPPPRCGWRAAWQETRPQRPAPPRRPPRPGLAPGQSRRGPISRGRRGLRNCCPGKEMRGNRGPTRTSRPAYNCGEGGGGCVWTGPLRPPAAGRPCRRHTHLRPSSPAPHLSPLAASPPTGTERLRGRQAIAHPMQMSRPPPALHWSAQLLSGLPLAGRAFHHSPIGYPLLAPEAGSRACATCRGGPVGSAVRLVENPGGGVGQSRAPLLPGACCGASGRS